MAELLERISSRELNEWMCYYRLEPWGEIQQEYRASMITSMVANTARNVKKRKKPFQADEFMRRIYLEDEPQKTSNTDLALWEKAKMIFGALGAKKES